MNPYFSIVTVTYNAEKTVLQTMNSILSQSFDDYEVIIKDGKSKDKTLQLIPQVAKFNIYSCEDNGIYDAMNQGILKARGKYLLFLNAGDCFAHDNVLEETYQAVKDLKEPSIIYGDYMIGKVLLRQAKDIKDFYLYRTPLCHQTMIISSELFTTVGLYDCSFKILADYDFTMRCWKNQVKFMHTDTIICKYLGGGVSESREGVVIKEKERRVILKKTYSKVKMLKYDFILICSMRKLRIWILSGNCPEFLRQLYRKIVNCLNSR